MFYCYLTSCVPLQMIYFFSMERKSSRRFIGHERDEGKCLGEEPLLGYPCPDVRGLAELCLGRAEGILASL